MKIAIIGTGAVGGYFGARLAHAGFDVSFIARGKQLQAILDKGLQIKSILGDFTLAEVKASEQISQLGQSDLIILGVKAWQIAEIRRPLKDIVHPDSIVLPLQNGVLAAEELAETLDLRNILGGVCRIISKVESPGVINHFGATPSLVFGELDKTPSERLSRLKSLFDQACINSRISDDINADIWKKFGFICVGGLMAMARCTLGALRKFEGTRSLISELVTEIVSLAGKMGIDMGSDYVDRTLSFIDSLPAETTFSMARDIWDGRPSELDYLNGAVVRLAQKYKVEVLLNRLVYNMLKINELKARI
jgi:2-dehydropantoate 2-reductase